MAGVRELPDHVREFIGLSKEYMRQETLDPAKQLGRFAGFAIGGAVAFAIGALFVAIAVMRFIREALPEGSNWAAVGYLVTAVAIGIAIAIIVSLTTRRTSGRS